MADLPRGFSSQFTMAKERIVQQLLNGLAKQATVVTKGGGNCEIFETVIYESLF